MQAGDVPATNADVSRLERDAGYRPGTPVEVAAAVQFLTCRDASYITGQMIVVDGGNSLPENRSWIP
jgi:NAD(P)-dependent dehydrogenase (short-subunit alcohol dehydrogenase family)